MFLINNFCLCNWLDISTSCNQKWLDKNFDFITFDFT